MVHLIDKDALVAEIKRLIDGCYKMCAGNLDFLKKGYPEHYYSIETYKEILSFIDTLEVKEVDLNKEIESYFKGFGKYPSVGIDDCIDIAKHFFELRLKAQKGE